MYCNEKYGLKRIGSTHYLRVTFLGRFSRNLIVIDFTTLAIGGLLVWILPGTPSFHDAQFCFSLMVDVAQLVEPRIVIPVVAGSIPVVHPINFPHKSMAYGYFTEKYCSLGNFWIVLFKDQLDLVAACLLPQYSSKCRH